jgi:hypothetical protein
MELTPAEILNTKTAIIPRAIAERVVEDRSDFIESNQVFINSCEYRFTALYNNNAKFKKLVENNKRDAIYNYMYKWYEAYLKNSEKYFWENEFVQLICLCGGCENYHRNNYSGDCRNDAERFIDEVDATRKLGRFIILD